MTGVINQKEYLKRYLSIGSEPGKKKKKRIKKISTINRLKVIDDDEVNVELFNKEAEADLKAMDEDAPQIVGIIDERPFEMRIGDYRDTAKWKPIGIKTEDGDDIGENDQHNMPVYIDDESTERKLTTFRIGYSNIKTEVDAKKESESVSNNKESSSKSDDLSPRRRRVTSFGNDMCNDMKRSRDLSPRRKFKRKSISPDNVRNASKRKDDTRNKSVPSKDLNIPPYISKSRENHTPKSSDISPPRRRRDRDSSPTRDKRGSPRRQRSENREKNKIKTSNDRKDAYSRSSESNTRSHDDKYKQKDDSKLKSVSKSSGKEKALKTRWDSAPAEPNQLNSEQNNIPLMLNEITQSTRQEREIQSNLSGAGMAPIFRDRKTGKIRNPEKEAEEKRKKAKKEETDKEKYNKWGKGVKQVEDEQERLNNELYEMSKPLARYADDPDLEKYLKEKEREGDPMLAYIRKKKKKAAIESGKPVKPQYEGEFMPNRYGIRPGYRWDGVDRSNGYEKRLFNVLNSKKAQQEDVYKWSTEDM